MGLQIQTQVTVTCDVDGAPIAAASQFYRVIRGAASYTVDPATPPHAPNAQQADSSILCAVHFKQRFPGLAATFGL